MIEGSSPRSRTASVEGGDAAGGPKPRHVGVGGAGFVELELELELPLTGRIAAGEFELQRRGARVASEEHDLVALEHIRHFAGSRS